MNRTARCRLAMPAAILACAWALAPTSLRASSLAGDWVGSDVVSDAPSSLRLRIDDGTGAVLRFGAGRNCTLTLRAAEGRRSGTHGFRITESSGGAFCDQRVPGTLQLVPMDGARLSLSLAAGDRRHDWVLRRAGAAADPALHGAWSGWLSPPRAATPVDVRLTIGGTDPGDADSTLRQGGERQCQVGLSYQGATGSAHYFQALMRQVAGGYCETLVGRLLRVEADGAALRFRFVPDDGQCGEGCVLHRDPG